ncbi:MAG: tRNA lysidine(34) synthetase TilS [Flavobacteriales bacterium]|nr:tRNA lysidine(34) synthetase TilS [Flavobacteriales bacterium]
MNKGWEHTLSFWNQLKDKSIYLGCSGGVDSMVLLHLLHSLKVKLTVLHVNYQLRDEASDADEQFVRSTCKQLGIPFQVKRVDLKSTLENGGNLQEEARIVRYNWFHEILEDNSNNRVALAHHQDDQIETFWLNLARKSGIMGLACMKHEHNRIVRPLLDFSRAEVLKYAKTHSIEWREDQSNSSNTYRRNRLRNVFIPELDNAIPSLRSSTLKLIAHFQETQSELEEKTHRYTQSILEEGRLLISTFDAFSREERIELLRQLNILPSYSARLAELTEKGTRIEVNTPLFSSIVRDEQQFTFLRKKKIQHHLIVEEVDRLPSSFSKDIAYFDADKIQGELQLRPWKIGDRIAPIGMNGSQMISDIIKDAKITADIKQQQLVIHDDDSILWCVGLKISRNALPDSSTKRILRCSIS